MTLPARRDDSGFDGSGGREPEGTATTPEQLVAATMDRWRDDLAARAGDSALLDVDRLGDARLDLSKAHPSGIAQLFAGRETRLSNLLRDGGVLVGARRSARAVVARADDHAQRYGLASAFLAIGVARWTEPVAADQDDDGADGPADDVAALATATRAPAGGPRADTGAEEAPRTRTVRAPVLLRPVAVRARGRGESDFDLTLEPSLEVNPLLATALRSRGALLDPYALARGTFAEGGFDPRAALDRLRSLGGAVLEDFSLDERLLIGTFVHPEQVLVGDLETLRESAAGHEVLRALAEDADARAALAHPLPEPLAGDRPLEQERGVGDLDPAQVRVLDALAAGHHLLLDAPPGSDVAGTLAAVVADAAATGRTVLYVAGHRRAGHALVERLTALGLDELVLDVAPDSGWRQQAASRLLAAMTVQPVAVPTEQVAVVQRELLDRRRRLAGYIEGLHRTRRPWEASAYDALQSLARLTSARPGPQTTVRLSAAVAESLTPERRAQAAADLVRVAALGAFTAATRRSAWYGADLVTPDRAREALRRVEELLDTVLPRVTGEAERVAEATGLVAAQSPAQWSEQLTMLAEVRRALDVFQPIVFERSAADLVAATATSAWRAERGIEMSGMVRRRLRKQAKDLLRPGRPVEDLHGALAHVQQQREVWQAHCPAGGWPRVPGGLAEIEDENAELVQHLDALSATLGLSGDARLENLPWAGLAGRLQRLRQDQVALEVLPERTALLRNLGRQGLGALVQDLEDRQVGPGGVAAELDLAWWTTVFEEILRQDPALAGYDGTALARLVAEFRALDRRHLRDRALLGLAEARELLRTRLRGADEEAQGLFAELVEHRFSGLRTAVERYPRVVRHLRPCLVASPMLVPQLLPSQRTEDLVVLDAAGHLPIEAVVPALARGRQVLVVGDTRSASGTALPTLAEVLPTLSLHADASRRDPHLTAFLADHGYAGLLTATPLPATQALLRLDVVEGVGMPNAHGAVESTQAEVDHVLELVTEHALTRPEESLAVVTASPVHATRVRDAVMAEVRENPALERYFRADRAEPFVVVEVGATQGLSRDAVVLSVGFGRTPHGRVLHRFGALSDAGGEARLLEALGATRHRLTVVSCFGADDLDEDRLRAPGALALRDLLRLAAERTAAPAQPGRTAPDGGAEPDRLVLDLAERLWRMGLPVDLHHGVPGGARLPLVVGHPDVPDEWLVAVLTDDDAYVGEPSVRARDRQVAERLERLGWTVAQVWSAAVFLDPTGEAEAIAQAVAEAARRRVLVRAARPVVQPPARVVEDAAADDDEPREDDGAPAGTDADSAPDAGGGVDTGVAMVTAVPTPRGPRPMVERGLAVNAYTDDQLDDLVAWIRADGRTRDDDELAAALRAELGVPRRGARLDAVVEAAVRRSR
ncbi:hypothetical protein [Actinotalea sp. Marseille-Q4924]|uniref:hypothetical protein n=1 Tax=Actinotalea sp. Marseille-Q4924 TaxID=2866571 RepID=UPI001CE41FED|nr:hypothetical protein [Actinotalea sp. Marseille-Q4924]